MADNSLKTPLGTSLNNIAIQRAADAIQLLGKALPASVTKVNGSIVTVKFELAQTVPFTLPEVTVPLFGPEYIRYPIQAANGSTPGTKGMVVPANAYLGGMSGLGGGIADLTQRGNLTALVFLPFGNTDWAAPDDPQAVCIYGPAGVILRDSGSKSVVKIDTDGISLAFGGFEITIDKDGITIGNNTTIDGKVFLQHEHQEVQSGTDNTGSVA